MTVRLPSSLTWRFGDYRPPPPIAALEGTPVVWTESLADRGASRLLSQFRDKARIVAYLRAVLGAGIQDLHDAIYQALTERWIDTALGAQLDRIGWLLDLPRAGWPDETYRLLLRAQVLVLRSNGRWGDLIKILVALYATATGIRVRDVGMAAGTITSSEDWDAGNIGGALVFSLLERAKAAGTRLLFEHPASTLDAAFTLSSSAAPERDIALGASDFDDPSLGGALSTVHASTTTETF